MAERYLFARVIPDHKSPHDAAGFWSAAALWRGAAFGESQRRKVRFFAHLSRDETSASLSKRQTL